MTFFLTVLFLLLIAASLVSVGRLAVPAAQREPLSRDLGDALVRGVKTLDHLGGTYITTRAAHR